MLRISEIRLPLDHKPEALKAAILAKLRIPADALLDFAIFKRAHDARKKSNIQLIYIVDATLTDEARTLARFEKDAHVRPTPDLDYKFVAQAPKNLSERPIVIGAGPCGLFA